MESVEQRLERLERQNRRMKLAGGAVLLMVAAVIVMACAKPAPQVLEVGQLNLTDTEGNKRAEFWGDESGAMLRFYDNNDVMRVSLSSLGAMPALTLFDENKKPRLHLEVSQTNEPLLLLWDENKIARAVLGCSETIDAETGVAHKYPESTLFLFSKDNRVLFKAPSPE